MWVRVQRSKPESISRTRPFPFKVSMEELGTVVPPLTGQVFDWLADRGIRPAGPALLEIRRGGHGR